MRVIWRGVETPSRWREEVVPLLCWGAFLVLMVVSVNGLMGGGA